MILRKDRLGVFETRSPAAEHRSGLTDGLLAVSILLPVHNAAETLLLAVESLLGQTFRDFELIIIDDGSTDGSLELAGQQARRDNRIRLIGQARAGLVETLNRGLRMARAPLVARMDADDIAHPARLMKQTAFLCAHPEIAVVGSAYREINEQGTVLGHVRMPCSPARLRYHLRYKGNPLGHPSVMIRRDLVLAAGGYRDVFPHAEDYDLWLRLDERYNLDNIDEELIDYRRRGAGVSLRNLEQQQLSAIGARQVSALRRRGLPDPADGLEMPVTRQLLLDWGVSESELNVSMHQWIAINRELAVRMGIDLEVVLSEIEQRYSKGHAGYRHRRPLNRLTSPTHRFSVVVPAHNQSGFVRRALISAMRAESADEILVVDDGSNDDTPRVIASLRDRFPERIRNLTSGSGEHLGVHRRLNQLVAAAHNEYIAALKADDLFVANRFEAVEGALGRVSFDLAFGDMLLIDPSDSFVGSKREPLIAHSPLPKEFSVGNAVNGNLAENLLFYQNVAGTISNFIFSKRCHEQVGGFRDFRYVYGWDFALRALLVGKVHYVGHYLTAERFHPLKAISHDTEALHREIARMAEGILIDLPRQVAAAGVGKVLTSLIEKPYSEIVELSDDRYSPPFSGPARQAVNF